MSAPLDSSTGIIYESIMFRDNVLEISFTEAADRGDGVVRVQTMVVDARRVPDEYHAFMSVLTDLVDAAAVVLRNPVREFRHG